MKIGGIEFDDPRESPFPKRDYAEYSKGVRTKVKEMWVCSYVSGGFVRHPITMTSGGACTFDGYPVRDDADKRTIKELFETIDPV